MGASESTSAASALRSEGSPQERLDSLLKTRSWLVSDKHHLSRHVKDVREAIRAGGDSDARDKLTRLLNEVSVEEEQLERAFKMFDIRHTGHLNRSDVVNMNKYLGFPAEDDDITSLMAYIDRDKSGSISLQEFAEYVGRMGGMNALLEERQKKLEQRGGRGSVMSAAGESSAPLRLEKLKNALSKCGIDSEAQVYWRMVVPESELLAVSRVASVPCQAKAISTIRRLARKNHQEAMPKLQQRVKTLGLSEDSLLLTLAWIRELAPIIVHINLDKMLMWMEKDTHYRNQFETKSSGGLLKPEVRKKWERDLFAGAYDEAEGKDRPKYGVQNVMNDYRGVVKCAQYGDSYMILKDTRLRCTFSPEDSANLKADKLAVPDFYAHVLNEYSSDELRETIKVANSADAAVLGDSDKVGKMKYKEAQIHGDVCFKEHVERLVVATRHRDDPKCVAKGKQIEAMCRRHGIEMTWMDKERDRMKAESMHKLGGAEWKERLARLMEDGGDSDAEVYEIPHGFCKVGCGRKVAPGVTRSGRPFKTCCRGCVMGFGHDLRCQQIDPTKVGPGLCRNGCGRKVARGRDEKGRPLATCCRGCAMGGEHDATCGKDVAVSPGMCRMGCGKRVAPGLTGAGKPYTTCCKGCAMGQGCSPDCQG